MRPADRDYLRRLPPEYYRGRACVHWSMTVDDRKMGWLAPGFHHEFREILTHAMFRYGFCCPIYCCMPDHLHLLWLGVVDRCDQRLAARFFRGRLNLVLGRLGVQLQKQGHDHVLRDDERQEAAFTDVVEYIARNPERAGLVGADRYREYPYTDCLVPGYPELRIWQGDFWQRFWRIYAHLQATMLFQDERPEAWP
jgi:putative transposase